MDNNEEIEILDDDLSEGSNSNYLNNRAQLINNGNLKTNKISPTSNNSGITQKSGKAVQSTGKAIQGAGKVAQGTGKAMQGAGKVAQGTGKAMQGAGKVAQGAGKAVSGAGSAAMQAGSALSSTGLGAIAGVPLAALGGITKAIGEGANIAGKGLDASGKAVNNVGKAVNDAGKNVDKAGKAVNDAGKNVGKVGKNISSSDKVTKEIIKGKNLKLIISICGGTLPFILIFIIILLSAVASIFPIFLAVTAVGEKTIYTGSNFGQEFTDIVDETWTEEEKKYFEFTKKQKQYYDGDFIKYKADNILKDKSETLDVSTVLSTTHYQGAVNILSYDDQYKVTTLPDGTLSSEYQGEDNVSNKHTKDFYVQAEKYLGNTFMIYPGNRELLGYLVENIVTFGVETYETRPCGDATCDNSSAIYSEWNYLGKIVAATETGAEAYYNPSGAVSMIESARKFGKDNCNNVADKWLNTNICYDTTMLYSEIFGERFDDDISVNAYLKEKYDGAIVPPGDRGQCPDKEKCQLNPGTEYITVSVKKEIDYELYEDYLKAVYIPYLYIDCEYCEYKNASTELKQSKIDSIYDEIMSLTNAFKYYNEEDSINDYTDYGDSSGGGTHGVSVDYNCGNMKPGSLNYDNHYGTDVNNVPRGTNVYPLFGGTVVQVGKISSSSTCYANCPGSYCYCMSCNGDTMGNYVAIKGIAADGAERIAYYLHFDSIPDNIIVGVEVDDYTVIGHLGTTGCSTGDHVHIDFRDADGLAKYAVTKANGEKAHAYKPTEIYTLDAVKSTVCPRK